MRKTKIVCTIGPASDSEDVMEKMCKAGMNVARLNFSHGTHDDYEKKIEKLVRVREKLGYPLAIMLDTKGPEYRIRTFKNGKVTLNEGDEFTFAADEIEGDNTRVSVSYPYLAEELAPGDKVLLNNGLMIFMVKKIVGRDLVCEVEAGGVLSDRKSMSFPNKVLKQKYLSEQDKADILFGVKHGVDYIACSFVSVKQDLIDIKNYLKEIGGEGIDLIAKIENRAGVENIEEICTECEGIMIGRGDMGVEIPYEELPAIQKGLITKCRLLGKRVITATEMLESMITNPRPTRAEISDVANAVYDGTSATMLSGESAAGKYPVEAVAAMARIAEYTEREIDYSNRFQRSEFRIKSTVDAISHATCGMASDVRARAIVVNTLSGKTARMVSRFRPAADIIAFTTNEKTWRKLALSWGVTPMLSPVFDGVSEMFAATAEKAKEMLSLKTGDKIVLTGGLTDGTSGNTDLVKIQTM